MTADQIRLQEIHCKAVTAYKNGGRDAENLLPREEGAFLATLGVSSQILLDYAEDFVRYGEPNRAVFVRVVEIRRDYFREVHKGIAASKIVREPELPRKTDEWEGVAWLPRITKKARCFLEGTLCKEVMYGCSGDRAFLRKHLLALPGFLEMVRDSGKDSDKILQYVRGT